MMKTIAVVAAIVVIAVVVIVVNAPPPDAAMSAAGRPIPIAEVFTILEAENDAVRQLWTDRIVGDGQLQGLRFGEDWREPGADAGPLPALFLRETAEGLRRSPTPLYLFLGSDFPINDANKFTGVQMEYFAQIKSAGAPQFFLDEEIAMHTAMFSDVAVDETCVSCHNNDPESPKIDWEVGDIMGATTWSYPKGEVSLAEALTMVRALRQAYRDIYEEYVAKAAAFANPPEVGDQWPGTGYFLPSADVFMQEADRRASPATLRSLLQFGHDQE